LTRIGKMWNKRHQARMRAERPRRVTWRAISPGIGSTVALTSGTSVVCTSLFVPAGAALVVEPRFLERPDHERRLGAEEPHQQHHGARPGSPGGHRRNHRHFAVAQRGVLVLGFGVRGAGDRTCGGSVSSAGGPGGRARAEVGLSRHEVGLSGTARTRGARGSVTEWDCRSVKGVR